MSKTTDLLEIAVADVIANRPAEGQKPSARQRAAVDRAFVSVMKIIAPRVRHFIKQYGLMQHWEDAEQVCAIGVHRAIEAYDPDKAKFTTFVNWQLRGELQGLRFRLMDDQRPSAKKVAATTISLNTTERGPDGEEMPLETMIEDEGALERTEGSACNHMAGQTGEALIDEYVRHLRSVGIAQLKRKSRTGRNIRKRRNANSSLPKYVHSPLPHIDPEELRKLEERIERDRDIVARHLFGQTETDLDAELDAGLTKERIRQITRRAARLISELASGNPRFNGDETAAEISFEEQKANLLPAANDDGQKHPAQVTDPDVTEFDTLMAATQTAARTSHLRH